MKPLALFFVEAAGYEDCHMTDMSLRSPSYYNLPKTNATAVPLCLLVPTQLGLQVQAGHDLSSVKDGMKSMEDDVSAVKDLSLIHI